MPVPITCPDCDNRFKVKNELAGGKVRCPKCGAVLPGKARKKAGGWGLLIGLVVGGVALVLLVGAGAVRVTLYLSQGEKAGSGVGLSGLGLVADNPRVTEDNFDRIK